MENGKTVESLTIHDQISSSKARPQVELLRKKMLDTVKTKQGNEKKDENEPLTRYNKKPALSVIVTDSPTQKVAWPEKEDFEPARISEDKSEKHAVEKDEAKSEKHGGEKEEVKTPARAFRQMLTSVESRIARSRVKKEEKVGEARFEAKTLDDAMERSMPFFLGGFSKQSPVRMKCFQMYKSIRWKALFIAINLANCLYIAAVPELYIDSFNAQGDAAAAAKSDRRALAAPAAADPHAHRRGLPTEFQNDAALSTAFEFLCVGAIGLELLVGFIAVGVVGEASAYLRCSNFHKLDFVLFLLTLLEYALAYVNGFSYISFRAFRLLKLLQPLLRMDLFRDVKEARARAPIRAAASAAHCPPGVQTESPCHTRFSPAAQTNGKRFHNFSGSYVNSCGGALSPPPPPPTPADRRRPAPRGPGRRRRLVLETLSQGATQLMIIGWVLLLFLLAFSVMG